MVREWKAMLDALGDEPDVASGSAAATGACPWGRATASLSSPPSPASRRPCSACSALLPDETFRAQVESISVPLLFLFQFDDELMTPKGGLALWEAFGSTEKTMHINPGPHVGIPTFERDESLAFFAASPSVKVTDDNTQDGVRARRFELVTERETVPGMVWTPDGAAGPRPKVLFGHGGSQHKKARNIVAMARALVTDHGFAAVAIDAVGHGDRVTEAERERGRRAAAERERARQRGAETGDPIQRARTATGTFSRIFLDTVKDWVEVLDAVEDLAEVGSGPTGWWGVSMGTGVGLPFVAREPRFSCAAFGLASASPENHRSRELAASITIPVLFLAQADDGGHPVPDALRLWESLGSAEKSLHLNPGPHVGIPAFERDASVAFFARHLRDGAR